MICKSCLNEFTKIRHCQLFCKPSCRLQYINKGKLCPYCRKTKISKHARRCRSCFGKNNRKNLSRIRSLHK